MDAKAIGDLAETYGATMLISTPTFCGSYVRRISKQQFARLKYAIVGAEKLREPLARIQNELFDVGADLSVPWGVTDRLRVEQGMIDGLEQLCDELESFTGRRYEPLERYRVDDAARALVLMGSSAGTAKDVVDELRDRHLPVGLLRIGAFRPFPTGAVRKALHAIPEVAVLDRADSPGGAPPLFAEVTAATQDERTRVRSVVYGLGGRDLHPDDLERVFDSMRDRARADVVYAGLRGAP